MSLWAKWKLGVLAMGALLLLVMVFQSAFAVVRAFGAVVGSLFPAYADVASVGVGWVTILGLGPFLVFEFLRLCFPFVARRLGDEGEA